MALDHGLGMTAGLVGRIASTTPTPYLGFSGKVLRFGGRSTPDVVRIGEWHGRSQKSPATKSQGFELVGVRGFEPPTSTSRT
jgi:hypothetical protein